MPINYPNTPDTTTAGGTLSATHADGIAEIIHALDIDNHALAIAALEAKVGTAASVPTNVGDVLTAAAGGNSSWVAPAGGTAVGLYPVSIGPWPQDDSGWTTGLIGPGAHPALNGIPTAPALSLLATANKLGLPSSIAALLESPPTTLQAQINATPSGGICYITPGYVYREAVTIANPITLVGRGRVSLRGSDDWSIGGAPGNSWTNVAGVYHSSLSMPSLGTDATTGSPTNTYAQNHRNVLFVDGIGYQLVNSATPGANQWAMGTTTGGDGGTTKAFISINPAGHKIEVGTRAPVITTSGNNALTLDGIDIRHVPSSGIGAPYVVDPSSITTAQYTVLNCMVGWTHGFGLSAGGMNPGPIIQDSIFHDCGVNGIIFVSNTNALAQRCIFFNCGLALYGWDPFNASAGVKSVGGSGTVYDGCVAFCNTQSGLWLDITANNSSIQNNVTWDNYPFNISNEITAFVEIHDNVVFRTPNQPGGLANADLGIFNSDSRQTNIYNNLVMHEPFNIKMYFGTRGDDPPGGCNGNSVHDNKLIGRYHSVDQGNASDCSIYWSDFGGTAISAVAAASGGNTHFTVGSSANFTTGTPATVSGVGGATELNGDWVITVVDGTHLSIPLAAHSAYTSGGVANYMYSITNRQWNNQYGYPGVVSGNLWSYQEPDTAGSFGRWSVAVNPVQRSTLANWVAAMQLGAGQWNAPAVTQTGFPGNGNGEVYMADATRVGYLRKFGLIP